MSKEAVVKILVVNRAHFTPLQAAEVSYEDLLGAKQLGFSDKQIAKCIRK